MPAKHTPKRGRGRRSRVGPRRALLVGVLALVAVGAVAIVIVRATGGRAPAPIRGVERFSGLSRAHVDGSVNYPQVPPVGGPHNPVWLNCGVYSYPVRNEYAVHSLEHGAVWVAYRPDLPKAQVRVLAELVGSTPYTILSPYPGLPAPVVVVAWGLRLELPSAADPRLKAFVDRYARGPQTPEPGAPCTGGIG